MEQRFSGIGQQTVRNVIPDRRQQGNTIISQIYFLGAGSRSHFREGEPNQGPQSC